ncbi:uncharacterized protein BXZ73DRAFT_102626 [Epithele typhae]|uniref:uncharacterized protein n=1 Tax=Epithele typhae TaxID=378194 RepID=UPI002007C53E|nr:uncharacterized protein BXZ73DRAFT_102626 [Epithele typhae]KAH9927493.1 hypothetical protein BXZ73DRAFT_102626 [Epithele typhae]
MSLNRLSQLFKSSRPSVDTQSRRQSVESDFSAASPVSYLSFPGLVPTAPQSGSSRTDSSLSSVDSDYAEMLDDDNMAWGKPARGKKSPKNARR